jgi:hypothetical protein
VSRRWDPTTKTLQVTVRQTQTVDATHPLFRFPVTIRLITADSVVRREITVSKAEETFPLALPDAPLSFRFDEGGWLLGTVQTDQTPAELEELAKHDLDIAARNWALRALDGSTDSAAVAARQFVVLNEHEAVLRAHALAQLADSATGDRTALTRQIVRSALNDPAGQVRAVALGGVARLDTAGVGDLALRMYRTDPSLTVQMAALDAYAGVAGPAALDVLVEASGPGHPNGLRFVAADRLGKLKAPRAAEALERMTDPKEPRSIRTNGLDDLAEQGDAARTIAVATRWLGDYDPLFAVHAVQTIAKAGGAEGRATLARAASTERRVTVQNALRAALSPRAAR